MSIKAKSDEQLMLEYASGNPEAFEELFGRYGEKLYNLFLRSLNKTELAQDLLQECFLRVIESRDRYQSTKEFSCWLFTIAMNLIRDKYREQTRRTMEPISESSELDELEPKLHNQGPDENLENLQIKEVIVTAINSLVNDQREAIILSKYQGLSFSEIAEILNISPAAAKQKAYRAMQNLRKKLAYLKED
ncbi:MAG: RNA polymerase sigma factor [bacterium]